MKTRITVALFFICSILTAQDFNVVDWNPEYKLTLADFKSESTQIGETNLYSVYSSASLDYGVQMTNIEFMLTKNFNSKVSNRFFPESAIIIAPNEETALKMVDFAQYEFDACELYARKFRKMLYEEKGTFSDISYVQPLFDNIRREYNDRTAKAGKATDLGQKSEELKMLHEEVLKEIDELADFCKTCKPKKKKKKK
ncbi:hypothetical protein [Flavobacterium alkalisoli]|uniref:hypothetical protein n=1 Tax=Flavobacterium alkalisoli TaxID=2602769 RepID=UPI003A919BAD